ncbi:MAG TPA: type VI secretion system baseplate subunit TssE [Alphaproteobacteria bacterium]|nr:type VI secretion system baseplate subunit TssE [Alphaproteobacteria bacterium]
MKQNKINKGTLAPLFERIIEDKSDVGFVSQLLNAEELKQSIILEVSTILNTRCTVRKVIYEDHLETIPLFGLPDFFGLSDFSYFEGDNPQDWPTVARFIETAISAAEPRLQNIFVNVESYDSVAQTLFVTVSAFIKESKLMKEIHFPLALQNWTSSQ